MHLHNFDVSITRRVKSRTGIQNVRVHIIHLQICRHNNGVSQFTTTWLMNSRVVRSLFSTHFLFFYNFIVGKQRLLVKSTYFKLADHLFNKHNNAPRTRCYMLFSQSASKYVWMLSDPIVWLGTNCSRQINDIRAEFYSAYRSSSNGFTFLSEIYMNDNSAVQEIHPTTKLPTTECSINCCRNF